MYFVSDMFQLPFVPFTSSYLSRAEFLGVNDMTGDPFLVMPYMPKGNVRQYIQKNPQCNKLKIVCGPRLYAAKPVPSPCSYMKSY